MDKELRGELEEPTILPFDAFAKQMIEVDKKWVSSTRLVSLDATQVVIAAKNPFRLYLKIQSNDANNSFQAWHFGMDLTVTGFTFVGTGYFNEYFPGKDGKLAGLEWKAASFAGTSMLVTETIYRGNTDQRSQS